MMKTLLAAILFSLLASTAFAQTQTAQFQLTWTAGPIMSDNSNAPTDFLIERSIGTVGPWAQVGDVKYPTVLYQDSIAGDTGGIIYCYRVRGSNPSGNGPYSGVACGTSNTITKPVPTAPTGLKATHLATP